MKIKRAVALLCIATTLLILLFSFNNEVEAQKRRTRCPQYRCMIYCKYGYVKDRRGCPTCRCKKGYKYGNTLRSENENIKKLNKPRRKCYKVYCYRPCKYGYKRDRYGCKTCACLYEKQHLNYEF